MRTVIEFVGGPKDGERLEVQGNPWSWYIAGLPEDFYAKMFSSPSMIPLKPSHLRGEYRRRSEYLNLFDWQGWS